MIFEKTDFPGLFVIKPKVFGDSRGFFLESFRSDLFSKHGINTDFKQDNHSRSSRGVLRGMHFQMPPFTQTKLVRVTSGNVLDVVLDLRRSSVTFGKVFKIELTDENHLQLYIPIGFAHGFQVLSEQADFLYKVDKPYNPKADIGISWQDPHLASVWYRLDVDPIISDKDTKFKNWDKNDKFFD